MGQQHKKPRSWTARLLRVLRHRLGWDEGDARRLLPPAALERLQQRVAASEAAHSGEIRLCIEAGLPLSYLWRDASSRERAVAMFGKLRVWDTEANNGVLVYVLLADRDVEIVADRGFNRLVAAGQWQAVCEDMERHFQAGNFRDGALVGIREVGRIIASHYPQRPGQRDEDELPNRPALL